jgi:hypothetical protein
MKEHPCAVSRRKDKHARERAGCCATAHPLAGIRRANPGRAFAATANNIRASEMLFRVPIVSEAANPVARERDGVPAS